MKICWDNLSNLLYLPHLGKFCRLDKKYKYLSFAENPCKFCEREFLTDSYSPKEFCCTKHRNKYYSKDLIGIVVGDTEIVSAYEENNKKYCRCVCLRCNKEFSIGRSIILKDIKNNIKRCCDACRYTYDFNNKKVGRLTILKFLYKNERHTAVWLCKCSCGTVVKKTSVYLNNAPEANCGCRAKEIAIQNSPYIELPINESYTKSNIASYDTYAEYLEWIEQIEKITIGNFVTFNVLCVYCGRAFTPTLDQVVVRSSYLRGTGRAEGKFYCSDNCKAACPIFGKREFPEGHKKAMEATSREVQRELRQLVLARDEWVCQYGACGKTIDDAELHCHHFEGINLNPIESADMGMCITFCKKHHNKVHDQKDCRYFELTCNYIMKNQS